MLWWRCRKFTTRSRMWNLSVASLCRNSRSWKIRDRQVLQESAGKGHTVTSPGDSQGSRHLSCGVSAQEHPSETSPKPAAECCSSVSLLSTAQTSRSVRREAELQLSLQCSHSQSHFVQQTTGVHPSRRQAATDRVSCANSVSSGLSWRTCDGIFSLHVSWPYLSKRPNSVFIEQESYHVCSVIPKI